MVLLFGFPLFGRDVPAVLVVVLVALLFFGYFLVARNAPNRVGFSGTGVMHQCERCGYNFQPERVEEMDDGTQHHFLDDRCPHCGMDEDENPHPHFPS